MRHGDGEPLLVSYDGADGTRGINVVMRRDVGDAPRLKRRVESGRLFDLATPYGYGGWLVEGQDVEGLFRAYKRWCAKAGIVCEFVRFHPMFANHAACEGLYDVMPLGEVVRRPLESRGAVGQHDEHLSQQGAQGAKAGCGGAQRADG